MGIWEQGENNTTQLHDAQTVTKGKQNMSDTGLVIRRSCEPAGEPHGWPCSVPYISGFSPRWSSNIEFHSQSTSYFLASLTLHVGSVFQWCPEAGFCACSQELRMKHSEILQAGVWTLLLLKTNILYEIESKLIILRTIQTHHLIRANYFTVTFAPEFLRTIVSLWWKYCVTWGPPMHLFPTLGSVVSH